ncbi:hypothetical protein [Streptomyces graminilatus]|uniref:hypothetical protein n=1 Tax=Streptomyces graminilatus TaxID=1464070 RepID=UPI0006E20A60|nr:hypothetical protein [Streptomyces graminilatus]
MRKKTRIIATSVAAAVALGIAAPAASAVTAHPTGAPVAAVHSATTTSATVEFYPEVELSSEAEAKAEGQRVALGRLGALQRLLEKSKPLFKAAVKAAKRGAVAFNNWVNSLSNFNPVKWAIKGSPGFVVQELIEWLANQVI